MKEFEMLPSQLTRMMVQFLASQARCYCFHQHLSFPDARISFLTSRKYAKGLYYHDFAVIAVAFPCDRSVVDTGSAEYRTASEGSIKRVDGESQ
jgi:hypothetical protein